MNRFPIAVPLALLCLSAAAAAEPQTDAERRAAKAYQASLGADALLAQGKYAPADQQFRACLEALTGLMDDDDAVGRFELSVKAADLPTLRGLDLKVDDLAKPGNIAVRVMDYADALEAVLHQTGQVLGTDEAYDDSSVANWAIAAIKQAKPGSDQPSPAAAAARMRLAVDKLEAALRRSPELRQKTINGLTGSEAAALGRTKLEKMAALAAAAPRNAEMPAEVRFQLDLVAEKLAGLRKNLMDDGFVADSDFERFFVATDATVKELSKRLGAVYDQLGQAMPADLLKPTVDRLAELKALALKRAPEFSLPKGLLADAGIEAALRGQLKRTMPSIAVLRVGMQGAEWHIFKNDVGIPESRVRYGFALLQYPGEKFPRCSAFSYHETYQGKGAYAKADGAGAYTATRWQSAK